MQKANMLKRGNKLMRKIGTLASDGLVGNPLMQQFTNIMKMGTGIKNDDEMPATPVSAAANSFNNAGNEHPRASSVSINRNGANGVPMLNFN